MAGLGATVFVALAHRAAAIFGRPDTRPAAGVLAAQLPSDEVAITVPAFALGPNLVAHGLPFALAALLPLVTIVIAGVVPPLALATDVTAFWHTGFGRCGALTPTHFRTIGTCVKVGRFGFTGSCCHRVITVLGTGAAIFSLARITHTVAAL